MKYIRVTIIKYSNIAAFFILSSICCPWGDLNSVKGQNLGMQCIFFLWSFSFIDFVQLNLSAHMLSCVTPCRI